MKKRLPRGTWSHLTPSQRMMILLLLRRPDVPRADDALAHVDASREAATFESEDDPDARLELLAVLEMWPELRAHERAVLEARLEGDNLDEVGARFGIGQEAARQRERAARIHLRKLIHARIGWLNV